MLAPGFAASPVPGPVAVSFELGGFALFSDAVRNGVLDVAGIFPAFGDPSVVDVTFDDPTPGSRGVFALDLVAVANALPAPEPISLGSRVAASLACGARPCSGGRAAVAPA